MKLKEALKGRLSVAELERLRGFDVVGDIAIIEVPRELVKKQKVVARTLLGLLPNVKVVARKKGGHVGRYRKQPLEILAGERRKTTVHREHGLEFALNVESCYFSPRLASERLRIAKQVRKGENVLVMFSGVAPYVLVIARHSEAFRVFGVEANPAAHKYAVANVQKNRLGHKVVVLKGDVRKVVPKLGVKFDRVVMPWPQQAGRFLDVALKVVKKGGFVNFYDFQQEDSFWLAAEKVRVACRKAGKNCKILRVVRCGQVAVRTYRVCVDVKVY